MRKHSRRTAILLVVLLFGVGLTAQSQRAPAPSLVFDHTHTYAEVVEYLQAVVAAYPQLTKLHKIGQSYLGKDLLVLELTSHSTGEGALKPGYWVDGNLHAGEVFGGEACLHTIQSLVTGYGKDPAVTSLLDARTFYIMPKLNPDGSDHYITKPDGMRSVVRPFDEDDDGLVDEDPAEDLNGDGYITMMRVRDEQGSRKTSPEDPRLMVPRDRGADPANWKGEWTVYQEGIDNDNDGEFNEDGVGGIDINRNFPDQWQPHPISTYPGPYPLSELESRAVADFMLGLHNLTGSVNYHMAGNVAVFPPSNLHTDPITGDVVRQPFADEQTYKRLGGKAIELINNVKVQTFKIHGASPATWHGSIWGVYVDWQYYTLGIYSFIHEVGIFPGVTDIFPSMGKEIDRLRWSDQNMEGRLFIDWKPFDHPQLGKVEIGGFVSKIYDPRYKTYTNTMTLPGPDYDKLLANHTKWLFYLASQSPLVRIDEVRVTPGEVQSEFAVTASIRNVGSLPTNVTEQALVSGLAKTVKASLELTGASLVGGEPRIDLGHLPGNSPARQVSWRVRATGPKPSATVKAISEKGGTDTRTVNLSR